MPAKTSQAWLWLQKKRIPRLQVQAIQFTRQM